MFTDKYINIFYSKKHFLIILHKDLQLAALNPKRIFSVIVYKRNSFILSIFIPVILPLQFDHEKNTLLYIIIPGHYRIRPEWIYNPGNGGGTPFGRNIYFE